MKHPFLISIISDEISQDAAVAIALAKEHGLDGVELRSVWDVPVELLPAEKTAQLKSMLADAGLRVSGIASSFLKEDWGVDDRAKFDRLVKACHDYGCDHMRGFSFWKSDDYSDEKFAAYLAKYDELLAAEGLTLMLENDPSVNLSTGLELARFFGAYDFKNIGILWDPGNDIYTCGDAVKPYPDEYNALRGAVRHVHIKDGVHNGKEGIGVAPGDGWLDITGQLKALADDGYTGWIALEPHFRLEGEIDEELLKRPGGAAFSEGGFEPSKLAMERMNGFLRELF